jgi:hypothetical protein
MPLFFTTEPLDLAQGYHRCRVTSYALVLGTTEDI